MNYFRPEIEALIGYTPGEQPQAGKFIKLNTNECPYPPSPRVTRAIQQAAEAGLMRYPDPMGNAFRRRAAEVLGVEPDWILCGNGSDDILTIVTRSLVGSGQLLRLPYPSYVLYKTLAQIQGAWADEVRFRPDWTLPEAFAAPSSELRLAFLPNPNSPSGTVVSRDAILLVSRTLSKSYALAGLRFGFLVGQPQVIAKLAKVKDSYNCDALAIAGATAAIDDQEWLRENVARINATRVRLSAGLEQLGFSVVPSQANFVWCQHPARTSRELYERLKQNRVLVRYMDYPAWGDGLRISVGTDEQIEACLALLKTMV